MPPMIAITAKRGDTSAGKNSKPSVLKNISIDLDDAGDGGSVRCSYSGNDSTPFGGDSKTHSFESRESLLGFVRGELLGSKAAEPKAKAKASDKMPADAAPDDEGAETAPDDEGAEGEY